MSWEQVEAAFKRARAAGDVDAEDAALNAAWQVSPELVQRLRAFQQFAPATPVGLAEVA